MLLNFIKFMNLFTGLAGCLIRKFDKFNIFLIFFSISSLEIELIENSISYLILFFFL
jgi:hypothetical protein